MIDLLYRKYLQVYSIGSDIIVPLLDESFIPEVVGQARNHFCDVKEITNMKFSL